MALDLLFATSSRRRMGKPPWTPLSIANCQLYLDVGISAKWQDSARTTPATADGDPLGAVDDLSGSARHATQATAAKRPTLKLAIKNGLPVVRHDGVDDYLQTPLFTLNQPKTVYVVAQKTGTLSTNRYFLDGDLFNTAVVSSPNATDFSVYAGGIGLLNKPGTPGNWNVIGVVFNGASSSLRLNGAAVAGDAGALNGGRLTIGAGGDPGNSSPLAGDWGTIVEYSGVVSGAELALLEAYLAARWAI